MTLTDEIQDHQVRCQPHLLALRLLARAEAVQAAEAAESAEAAEAVTALPRRVATEVAEATGAVLAEVEAADCDARAAVRSSVARDRAVGDRAVRDRAEPGAETLVEARLNRLAAAAADALAATLAGNLAEMRCQLDRFDALTSAIWTVQRAVYGLGPAPHRSEDAAPR